MTKELITPIDRARGDRIRDILMRVSGGDRKEFGARFEPRVSVQTVGNWINGKHAPEGKHLRTICALGGVTVDWLLYNRGPGIAKEDPIQQGFQQDAARYIIDDKDEIYRDALSALLRGRPSAYPWTMKSSVLSMSGVRPGDILIFDAGVEPRSGDVVRAQIEDDFGGAKTVVRLYQPPNLIGAHADPSSVPIETVDNERVRIAGVLTDLVRRRQM
jgi:hypothetical protein